MTWILAITLASSAVTALQPWPLKLLVDHALGDAPIPAPLSWMVQVLAPDAVPVALLIAAVLASVLLFALNTGLNAGLSWLWAKAGRYMVYDLAANLFRRLQRLSLAFHGRRTVGDFLSRLATDTWCVHTITECLLVAPARNVFTMVTIGILAWTLEPELTALAFVVVPLVTIFAFFFGSRFTQRARLEREADARRTALTQQTIASIPIVQAFDSGQRNRRYFLRLSEDAVALAQRNLLFSQSFSLLSGTIMAAGFAVVLYVGGLKVLSGALSVGGLLVFVAYLGSIQGATWGLLGLYEGLKNAEASIDRVLEVLDSEEAVRESPSARRLPRRPREPSGHVRLDSVTFGYDPGRPVLHEVTLEAAPGETLALVGPTGAGKSTLVSLIPRFFDPWQGRVRLDGHDVRDLRLADLRARIALVLQDPFLLPLSIADNIAYGRPGADREEIVAAAVAANAHDFIRRLEQGYDTVLGERGVTLSGGEKQRIAIARALLKGASVLILDEPTSALDALTEALLLDALERLMRGRTTFIIAHRLSTIRRADRIIVLDDGRLCEAGTHGELLAAGGRYHRLHSLQHVGGPRKMPA